LVCGVPDATDTASKAVTKKGARMDIPPKLM
jgi:hypothetical protein